MKVRLLARRSLLALPAIMAAAGRGGAIAAGGAADLNLDYREGWLSWQGGRVCAAAGRAGVVAAKHEGDGATPAGRFPLVRAFYRADRLAAPATRLPLRALRPTDAWVDDPADRNYNRLVALPYPAHSEALWLEDAVYDLIVVIGYNFAPVVPGAGSAIFLHVARPDFSPTAGCVAIDKAALVALMPLLGPLSTITISA